MLRNQLRKEFIAKRGNKCEQCGLSEWLGKPINLQIHHIDGNNQNDDEENLQVLCPNCHSFTDNYCKTIINKQSLTDEELLSFLKSSPTIHQALLKAKMSTAGRNYTRARKLVIDYNLEHLYEKKIKQENTCIVCGQPITTKAKKCKYCYTINNRTVERPSKEELKKLIRTTSFVALGKKYNVSDNAIRKWCDFYGLPRTKKEIKKYTDEEWILI